MIKFAVPLICTGILQLLFNAADLVVVGRFCSPDCVGAVGATSSLINLLVNFFVGFSVGTGVVVAHAIGANNGRDIHEAVHTAMQIALFCGAILTVVGVAFSRTFLEWMGTPPELIELSGVYMRIYFLGVTANMVYNFGASIMRAAGDTKRPLYFLFLAGIVNVILNIVLVYFFHMDVDGVAVATVASQVISAVLVVIALSKRDDACRFDFKQMRFHKDKLFKIIKMGLPAGLQSALFSISNVIIQSSVNSFGKIAVSGNSAGMNIEAFVWYTMNGFELAALNFVGQNLGAKRFDRIGKITKTALACASVAGVAFGSLAVIFSKQLLGIYLGNAPEEIGYGQLRLLYICLPYFTCGLMDTMTNVMRGMGKSTVPMVITVVGVCVFRIVWIYTLFQKIRTLDCLYISYPISWIITFAVSLFAYFVIKKKLIKKA